MKLFFILLLGIMYIPASSQKRDARCKALGAFLNFEQVISSFHLDDKADTLILADMDDNFVDVCKFVKWKNKTVKIVFDSAVNKKMEKSEFHHFFKDSCDLYVIRRFSRKGNSYKITIVDPCTNRLSRGAVKVEKGKYRLVDFERYDL